MKTILFFVCLYLVSTFAYAQTWKETNAKGVEFYKKRDYQNATIYFEKALPLAEKEFGKESKSYASACNNLANINEKQGLYLKAEPLFIEAKNIREKILGKEHADYATSCNNLAVLYKQQGFYTKAEPLFIEAKSISEKVSGREHISFARSCNNLGSLYEIQGLYSKAEPLYIEAKNILEKLLGKEHADYATCCNNLAGLYNTQALYAKAEPLMIETKNIYEKVLGKEHPTYATSCNNLAELYKEQGLYIKAESLHIEAKNIREKTLGKEHSDYANSCINLVGLYQSQGLSAKAESLLIEAKNIREKVLGKQHPDYSNCCNILAGLYRSQYLYTKADPLYMEAKNIREKVLGKQHPDYATSCNDLALSYYEQGLSTKAEPLYMEAKNIREKVLGNQHPDYATSCNNLASLYQNQGLYSKAEPLFIEAKNIIQKVLGKEHLNYAISCNNLAFLYQNQGLHTKAEYLYLEGIKPFLSQIENNFSMLSEKEKGLFFKSFADEFEFFNSFTIKRYKENPTITSEVYNNTLATKALLFNGSDKMRSRILNSKDERLIALFEEWKVKKAYLIKVYEMTLEQKKKNNIDVAKLENEANELEKQLFQKSEIFATLADKKRYTWIDVQKKLQKNEVAIEIIRFRVYNKEWTDTTKYMALLVKSESKYPEMVVLDNGNELEGQYAQYYQKMIKGKFKDAHSHAQYWKKIEEKLVGVKKIYLSVDGVYNSLSMNTLFDTTNKKYLFEKYDIELLTNTKDLCSRKTNAQKSIKKGNLIGFPDYNNDMKEPNKENEEKDRSVASLFETNKQRFFDGSDISELNGTKVEINNLSKILVSKQIKVEELLGKDATESNLKNIKFPEILHIATHGFFLPDVEKDSTNNNNKTLGMDSKKVFENPLLRSGLLFANAKNALKDGGDGVLTAFEAMNLDLDNTEIVVMSACETGLGEVRNGEGVYGLQRAFQTAGAKTILMSLWTVSDEATQELMTLFYENWIGKKQTKREAFKNAQNTLREQYPEPYYWGAFVMVGE